MNTRQEHLGWICIIIATATAAAVGIAANLLVPVLLIASLGLISFLALASISLTIPFFFLFSILMITPLALEEIAFPVSPTWFLVIAYLLVLALRYRISLLQVFFRVLHWNVEAYLFCFIILGTLSALYSLDPITSIRRSLGFFLASRLFLGLLPSILQRKSYPDARVIIRYTHLAFLLPILAGLFIYAINPAAVVGRFTPPFVRYAGIFGNPNTLGVINFVQLSLAAICVLNEKRGTWRIIHALGFGAGVYSLFMSNSRTAIIAALFTVCVIIGRRRPAYAFVRVVFILLIGYAIYVCAMPFFGGRGIGEISRLESFPGGRGRLWAEAVSAPEGLRVLTGYGMGSIEETDLGAFAGKRAHNVFLEAYVELGVLGVVVFTLFIVSGFFLITRGARDRHSPEDAIYPADMIALYVGLIIHGLGESALLSPSNPTFQILLLLIALAICENERKGKREPVPKVVER